MKLLINKQFQKDIKRLPKHILNQLLCLIEYIEMSNGIDDIQSDRDFVKIQGVHNMYRIRLGDYRVGMIIQDATIHFLRVLHRNEIYKYFP